MRSPTRTLAVPARACVGITVTAVAMEKKPEAEGGTGTSLTLTQSTQNPRALGNREKALQ